MNASEQVKANMIDAMFEVFDYVMERFKKTKNNEELIENQKELSPDAKELLEQLKANPETARTMINNLVIENINVYSDEYNRVSKEALDDLANVKKSIDLTSKEGLDLLSAANKIESVLLLKNINKDQVLNEIHTEVNKQIEAIKDKEIPLVKEQVNKAVIEGIEKVDVGTNFTKDDIEKFKEKIKKIAFGTLDSNKYSEGNVIEKKHEEIHTITIQIDDYTDYGFKELFIDIDIKKNSMSYGTKNAIEENGVVIGKKVIEGDLKLDELKQKLELEKTKENTKDKSKDMELEM
ncbi:hypothetical protein [Gottfriedia solisilvae]|uniref:hypothetical protein n=1 Tax=Gottfriedia solisilvae TaxID=1516104 RepID=UPI003D2F0B87